MYKVESAVLTELQVPCVCFTATDVSRQLLLPGVHIRNCKNSLVYGDRLTTEFRLVGFFIYGNFPTYVRVPFLKFFRIRNLSESYLTPFPLYTLSVMYAFLQFQYVCLKCYFCQGFSCETCRVK